MMLIEILPSLQKLSHQEKIRAIQFLATELAKDEQTMNLLEDGKFGRPMMLFQQRKF
jgi:hypothetical protein